MAVRYLDVVADLRQRIDSGAIPVGGRLPSEDDLAAHYRVGRPTLRRALEALQDEGLVEKHHGRGNFVREPLKRITYVGSPGATIAPDDASGISVGVEVNEVEPQGELALLAGACAGTPLVEYAFLAKMGDVPYGLARVYVPRGLASSPRAAVWSPWDASRQDQAVRVGLPHPTAVERVTTRFPTADEARTLQVTTRTSVLVVEYAWTNADGRAVQAAVMVLPGDRSEVRFTTAALQGTEAAG